jgi:hypothetical protein
MGGLRAIAAAAASVLIRVVPVLCEAAALPPAADVSVLIGIETEEASVVCDARARPQIHGGDSPSTVGVSPYRNVTC